MSEFLLIIVILAAVLGALTVLYKKQPFKVLPKTKPKFVLFPKYTATYQRSDAEIEKTLAELVFTKNPLTGLYTRGKVRNGIFSKSIKLTISVDRDKKEIAVYSTLACILYDDGEIWQLAHDIVHGLNRDKNIDQELVDMFKRNGAS